MHMYPSTEVQASKFICLELKRSKSRVTEVTIYGGGLCEKLPPLIMLGVLSLPACVLFSFSFLFSMADLKGRRCKSWFACIPATGLELIRQQAIVQNKLSRKGSTVATQINVPVRAPHPRISAFDGSSRSSSSLA